MNDKEKASLAFFAGLIQGWTTRMEEGTSIELKKDMINESNRLAKLAGVKLLK